MSTAPLPVTYVDSTPEEAALHELKIIRRRREMYGTYSEAVREAETNCGPDYRNTFIYFHDDIVDTIIRVLSEKIESQHKGECPSSSDSP